MGTIVNQVIDALTGAGIRSDEAYPGRRIPALTGPVAAVRLGKIDRSVRTTTVEVVVMSPASGGGSLCENTALRAVETLQDMGSDGLRGLTKAQIRERRARFGENRLQEKAPKTALRRFLEQFKDAMILILLAAAAVSFTVALIEGDSGEFFEPVLILLIVVLNAVLGVMQESKAEKALEALKGLSAPHARVIREGEEQLVEAAELVPGDIIRLEAGDFVPADARLLQSVSLKSEESALTGESVPAEKDASAKVAENAPLGDRVTMVYSGCSITYGTATAVVTATGMETEMGRIADLLEGEGEGQTPLQEKLSRLGRLLGVLALGACGIIFVVGLMNGIPALEIFMTAVSLAVSAIPEGLSAIVTIVLSIGVQRMVKKNAIIRRLPAVETLGSASVICSDKTGTLTQNRMTMVKAWVEGDTEDISQENSPAIRKLLLHAHLAGFTEASTGTVFTIRCSVGTAYRSPQFDQGLGKISGPVRVDLLQSLAHLLFVSRKIDRGFVCRKPCHQPQNIAVHSRGLFLKGNGTYCPGSIFSNSGKRQHRVILPGEFSAKFHNLPGGFFEISDPVIIAQTFPQLVQQFIVRLSQGGNIGQSI